QHLQGKGLHRRAPGDGRVDEPRSVRADRARHRRRPEEDRSRRPQDSRPGSVSAGRRSAFRSRRRRRLRRSAGREAPRRRSRPPVVSMSDLAASGGYYIAMPGQVIVAQPSTLTGSIGIFGGKFVTGGVYEKLGAHIESTSIGRNAEINSPARAYNPAELKKLQEQLQAFYDQFVEKVADSRHSTPEKIDALAQGRV